jgi:alpha-glucosidase
MHKLICLLFASLVAGSVSAQIVVSSPDGKLETTLTHDANGQLVYSIRFNGQGVLAPSPLGVTVDGVPFGAADDLGKVSKSSVHEKFPWRGTKSQVDMRGKSVEVALKNRSGATWRVQLCCFDNAVAWRAIVPGKGTRKVSGEASAWVLPAGTAAWCNPNTANCEGIHERWLVNEIPADHFTNGINLPVTFELPGGGYAALSEAEVMGYSGMTVEPTGTLTLKSSFRMDREGWPMDGEVRTPWRVMMVAADLNGLVNCDAIAALCPAPDKQFFPKGIESDYLKPGRCLWQWWAYDDPGTHWTKQHWFVDQAAALNCKYYLVDEGWEHSRQEWASQGKTAWERMKELCDYAASKGVGIWVWRGWIYNEKRQWDGLETQEKREAFFRHCAEAGVKGTKIDFMDSQSHDRLAFYEACLRTAAKYKIMVNFHGANKPAGEERTWPNEMTREAVRGLEYNKWDALPPAHYATLPFTRYLVGHGDFTPTTLQAERLKGTTVAQQLACAVVTTSPILCWADKPDLYLASPVAEVIRSMPPVWEETRVLPGSKIGDLAIFARRSGKDWYVGIINGGATRTGTLDLSFLGRGRFSADIYGDVADEPTQFAIQHVAEVSAKTSQAYRLNAGGGLVVRLRPL